MPAKKKIALIQMSCSIDTQDNLTKAASLVRDAARAGADIVLPARALSRAVLLPARGPRSVRHRRADSRTIDRAVGRSREGRRGRDDRQPLRAARARALSQHGRSAGELDGSPSRESTARCTSRTTRSTMRSSTSRRAISASRRSAPARARSARSSAGISGTRRRRG